MTLVRTSLARPERLATSMRFDSQHDVPVVLGGSAAHGGQGRRRPATPNARPPTRLSSARTDEATHGGRRLSAGGGLPQQRPTGYRLRLRTVQRERIRRLDHPSRLRLRSRWGFGRATDHRHSARACVVLAPAIGAVADRLDPARALLAGYGIQAITISGVALALALDAPTFVIYLLAPLTALSMCMTRPPQSALLPSVVRTADELTSANVMTVWTEGAAALIGPAIAGILLASSGQATAMAVMAGLNILSMLLVLRAMLSLGPIKHHSENSLGTAADSLIDGVRGNLVRILMNPHIRVLLILTTFYFILVGSLDFLCVVLALGILHMGPGGAGYLNAAIGAGELVAGFATAFLIGRRRLVRTLVLSLLGWVGALALIAAYPRTGVVLALFVLVGLSGAVYNATGRTLMQRAAPRTRSREPFPFWSPSCASDSYWVRSLSGSATASREFASLSSRPGSPPSYWSPLSGGDCEKSTTTPTCPKSKFASSVPCGSLRHCQLQRSKSWLESSRRCGCRPSHVSSVKAIPEIVSTPSRMACSK